MRPVNVAARVTIGLMWPPEMGWVARRRMVMTIAAIHDITRLGVLVLVSIEEMTMVSSMNTRHAVPRTSPTDALQT